MLERLLHFSELVHDITVCLVTEVKRCHLLYWVQDITNCYTIYEAVGTLPFHDRWILINPYQGGINIYHECR